MGITFDASVEFDSAAVSPVTIQHTLGAGRNRMVLIGYATESSTNPNITGVTYDGVPVGTQVVTKLHSANELRATIWAILDSELPAGAGTYDVVITLDSAKAANYCIASFFGVAQHAAEATGTNEAASTTDLTTEITTISSGALLFQVFAASSGGDASHGAGQIELSDGTAAGFLGSTSYLIKASAGATSVSDAASVSSTRLTGACAAFAPAMMRGRSNPLSLDLKL